MTTNPGKRDTMGRGMASHGPNAIAEALAPWCRRACRARLAARAERPWILGLQGPQGCGKSTAAAALVDLATRDGKRALSVSIDDFYLTYDEQTALAARHPGNPTLLYRGYPGTHDVELGARVIDALAACRDGEEVVVPAYDKSAHAGRGDRAPEGRWRRAVGPFDLVIVEGWMLGFAPVDEAILDAHGAQGAYGSYLAAPNRYLAAYAAWTSRLHALAHLTVESPATIVEWRVASERARRERGEAALSDDDARDYIERFLPAYRAYVPALRARPPCADFVALELDAERSVIATDSR